MKIHWWLAFSLVCLSLLITAQAMERFIEHNGIRLEFVGASDSEINNLKEVLTDQLTLSGASQPSEPLADDMAFFARQHFVGRGYAEARVKWEIVQGGVRLALELGEPMRLGNVRWQGDLVLDEGELRKFFLAPMLEKDGVEKSDLVWIERDVLLGVVRVTRRLRTEGYLNAEVELQREVGPDPLTQDVLLLVRSGPQFVLGKMTLDGQPPELNEDMQRLLNSAQDGPFSEAAVQQLEQRLLSVATERGWLAAQVASDYTLQATGGEVDVEISLEVGHRAQIQRIVTDPMLSKGARRILDASFRPLPGRPYSVDELDEAFRRALGTNVFARLEDSVRPIAGSAEGDYALAELYLSGEETKPKTLGFEVGLDTFLGVQVGITFRNTNLMNSGNSLAAEANYSLAGPTGFLSVTDPAWLGSAYSGSVRVSGERFSLYEYDRSTLALGFEMGRRLNRHFNISAFSEWSASSVVSDLPEQFIGPDSYGYVSCGFSMALDYRDSLVLPKKGWMINAQVAYNHDILGDGASFTRGEWRGAFLQPLSDRWRIACGAAGEVILGAELERVPIDSRVFNGGPNSVRGFAMRELGPVTPGDTPLGGIAAVFASVELSYEIFANFEIAVFGDVGSIGLDRVDEPFGFSTDFRPSVGAGLRYHLPFGPLRLDYGYNLDRREVERMGMVHLTAGFAF